MPKLKHLYQFVKDLLSGFSGREFFIFLFFLALSGVFWLMMTLNETYEQEYKLPVVMQGKPANVLITQGLADTVRVTIRDKGYMLLSYSTGHKLHALTINFKTYANVQTGRGQVPAADLQKLVRQQLYAGSTITALKADRLDFYFNYGKSKRVKVRLDGNIQPARNYYIAQVQIEPEAVTVYASESTLREITTVSTDYLSITNVDDTLSRQISLKTINGAKVVPEQVTVTVYPDVLTEGSVDVPVTTINKPANIVVRTFPQRVKVKFTVGTRLYNLVSAGDFQVVADYNAIKNHPSDKCHLTLLKKSRFVRNARIDTPDVDYLIEQQ